MTLAVITIILRLPRVIHTAFSVLIVAVYRTQCPPFCRRSQDQWWLTQFPWLIAPQGSGFSIMQGVASEEAEPEDTLSDSKRHYHRCHQCIPSR